MNSDTVREQSESTSLHQFSSGLSLLTDTQAAVDDACERATKGLNARADLGICFVSPHHWEGLDSIAEQIRTRTGLKCLLGCTGESIVSDGHEVEGKHAISLWLAALPGVQLTTMQLDYEETAGGTEFLGWPDELIDNWPSESTMIVLADPWSFPADRFIAKINEKHRTTTVIGGMASGGRMPGENRLYRDGAAIQNGAVALLMSGPIRIRTVVSQGCRPIGRHFIITKANQNLIEQLGGKPALEQFQAVYESLTPDECNMVRQGLHIGRVVNEYQAHFERGDFLVRNVSGADRETGAIAIGDLVRVGQTIQFHVRDAETADEDLRLLLSKVKEESSAKPAGALLFTCNGRGTRLFLQPDHDSNSIQKHLGAIPVAGFFAQGEIGPIGGKSFLHGFTASIAIFFAD